MNEKIKTIVANIAKSIKENWRIMLVAAIVIMISLSSSWFNQSTSPENKTKENQSSPTAQSTPSKNNSNNSNKNNPANTAQAKEETAPENSNDVFAETAQKSEGLTHLARKAIKTQLSSTGESLSSEQKIYAEDYIVKKTGSRLLEIGETVKFQKSLVNDSIAKAKSLSETQTKNLSKFVPLVKNLN